MTLLAYDRDGQLLARIETHGHRTVAVWMPTNAGIPLREPYLCLESAREEARRRGAVEFVTAEELE